MKLISEEKILSESKKYEKVVNGKLSTAFKKGVEFAQEEIENKIQKRFYWIKPDGTISNMWDEKTHNLYLTKEDIEKAQSDGWNLIEIHII